MKSLSHSLNVRRELCTLKSWSQHYLFKKDFDSQIVSQGQKLQDIFPISTVTSKEGNWDSDIRTRCCGDVVWF